jgi:hypothetical protein
VKQGKGGGKTEMEVTLNLTGPTTNQSKEPTSQPLVTPTLFSTVHMASELSVLYSTGAAVSAVPQLFGEAVN